MSSLSLISASPTPCGVECFARLSFKHLAAAEPGRHDAFKLTGQPGEIAILSRVMASHETFIVNLPVVAWKRVILGPLRAMRAARRLGKEVVLVLHEWGDLDWKRRATYVAYLPYATRVVFSSPTVRAQFEADPASRLATKRRALVPIPPTIEKPGQIDPTSISNALTAHRHAGKLVLGHFGSIYPKKQSMQVLEIAAALKARGKPVHAAFIGSFITGGTLDPKAAFEERVRALGLDQDVTVTGYVGEPSDIFAALSACDAAVYMFAEGLTSRRSSVLACLMSTLPVFVNASPDPAEFTHHPAFSAALASGRLTLLPHHATAANFADAIMARQGLPAAGEPLDFARAWTDAVAALVAGN